MNMFQPIRQSSGLIRGAWVCSAAVLACFGAAPLFAAEINFNRDIRPILSDNCFQCHGPDRSQRKARLRLDDRESAIERQAIVPGKPEESELVARIFSTDPDDVMPPPDTHKTLTAAQKEKLKQWIAQGAEYQLHWAYARPEPPPLPPAKDPDWVRTPIDAFILHTLEQKGIKPSPRADARTLLRRLSLDLIGLPPTPGETARFLQQTDPKAYEREVERLLASPHYGERMAAPWFDVVRFSDTVGYHGDQIQRIFPYRDYVIDSFNQNKPFDQFTIEQIAGDLLPNPTTEQIVATGFNRLNMMTREGGAQPEEYLAKYAADRVRTVSTAWLGSTMACAECHDHKYDPITAKDFYQMAAFFADIKQWGVYQDYHYTPNPDLRGWSNDHPFPPEIEVESPYLQARKRAFEVKLQELYAWTRSQEQSAPAAQWEQWRQNSLRFLEKSPNGWSTPKPAVIAPAEKPENSEEANYQIQPDGTILFTGKFNDLIELALSLKAGPIAAIRLDLLPHEKHGGGILRGARNTTVTLSARLQPRAVQTISTSASTNRAESAATETRLRFYHADTTHKEERYANGENILGVQGGWRTSAEHFQSAQSAVYLLDPPIVVSEGDKLVLGLGTSALGHVRISVSPFARQDPSQMMDFGATLAEALQADKPAHAQKRLFDEVYYLSTATGRGSLAQFKQLHRELLECRDGRAFTMVTEAWEPKVTRTLPRGNWQDESGEIVQPAAPHFLPQPQVEKERRLTRLDLARWLVSPENPLTARTVVNRLWHQFFGAGICNTLDDLGLQGEPPTHPELLDWLAVEFQESGWDLKHMIRLIVLSSTYQQDSNLRPDLREIDPNNRLLASQSPRRLDAEFIRDNALFVAGLLNPEPGGPSTRPYQPAGYYVNLQFPDRDYIPHRDERQYRRGVYMHWQRTFLHPMLANFDASSREECLANRTVSNTPQQALTLLNDPSFVEAARVFAQELLRESAASDSARLERAFEKALARPAKPGEAKSLTEFLEAFRAHYRAKPDQAEKLTATGLAPAPESIDPVELAAWTSLCRVMLNLHETITRY
jgi:hypothetical protein